MNEIEQKIYDLLQEKYDWDNSLMAREIGKIVIEECKKEVALAIKKLYPEYPADEEKTISKYLEFRFNKNI